MPSELSTIRHAKQALLLAWPRIMEECLSVLGSELHYQAMVYYCLRTYGQIPASQLGMNVKMWVDNPKTKVFKACDKRKHENYRGGCEPIPDVVIFRPSIRGDWRRRNFEKTLKRMLIAIELKASERSDARLRPGEIIHDIEKLAAHREEVKHRRSTMYPVVMVIDSAPEGVERMTSSGIEAILGKGRQLDVGILYCSPTREVNAVD